MVRVGMMAIAAAVVGNLAAGTPAKAIEWPWCADLFSGKDGTATNCGFANLRQCETYIHGIGGWCYPNPRYREEPSRPRIDWRR